MDVVESTDKAIIRGFEGMCLEEWWAVLMMYVVCG